MPEENSPQNRPRRHGYEKVLTALQVHWKRRAPDLNHRVNDVIDNLWETFGGKGYSWLGFYMPAPGNGGMLVGIHRGDSADPTREELEEVRLSAENKSSQLTAHHAGILVPVLDSRNATLMVLGARSPSTHFFNEEDRRWLERIVKDLGHARPQS